jgi:hypothetical protein
MDVCKLSICAGIAFSGIGVYASRRTCGSKKTVDFAIKHNKPWLHLDKGGAAPEITLRFIREHAIATLNVAGPRASKETEVGAFVKRVLEATLFP